MCSARVRSAPAAIEVADPIGIVSQGPRRWSGREPERWSGASRRVRPSSNSAGGELQEAAALRGRGHQWLTHQLDIAVRAARVEQQSAASSPPPFERPTPRRSHASRSPGWVQRRNRATRAQPRRRPLRREVELRVAECPSHVHAAPRSRSSGTNTAGSPSLAPAAVASTDTPCSSTALTSAPSSRSVCAERVLFVPNRTRERRRVSRRAGVGLVVRHRRDRHTRAVLSGATPRATIATRARRARRTASSLPT